MTQLKSTGISQPRLQESENVFGSLTHSLLIWYREDPYTEVRLFLESIEHDFTRVLKFETGMDWEIG